MPLITILAKVVFLATTSLAAQNFSTAECGQTKGCLFQPPNCVPFEDCVYALSYSATNSGEIVLEILGQVSAPTNTYVAVGFSKDQMMGQDTVTACASYNNSPFEGHLTYNPGRTNLNVPLDEDSQNMILRTIASDVDNNTHTVYCKLAQKIEPSSNVLADFVAPLNQEYFILMASGPTRTGSNPVMASLFAFIFCFFACKIHCFTKKLKENDD